MGTDDLFKKRRAERQKRKHEFKSVNTNSFLIVTEGEKTEPLYFKGLQKKINEKVNGRIDIVESPVIDIFGQGCSTSRLIEATEEIVKDSKVFYQNIWVVFDKDDFKAYDADLWNAIAKEEERQQNNIELIASENVVSKAVMAAQGSILTNKYAEGYPGRRYYGGTDVVDVVESLAIERAKEIFGAKFANVQPTQVVRPTVLPIWP